MVLRLRALCLLAVAVCAAATAADPKPATGDWPGWRGPDRSGVSTETGLLKEWPKAGPKLAWKTKGIGGGYSTVAVSGDRLFVTGAKGQAPGKGGFGGGFGGRGKGKGKGGFGGGGGGGGTPESVICLDAKDGKEIWSTKIGKTTGAFAGPRCTPAVSGGRVYALSSDGVLACLRAEDGKIAWKKDLKEEFGGKVGMFAYSESPLIDGDRLVCTPGGDKAALLCLDKNTGKEIWRSRIVGLVSTGGKGKGGGGGGGGFGGGGFGGGRGGMGGKASYNTAAYSSPVAGTLAGEKTYVQFLSGGVVGVSAKTGGLLWHYDAPSCGMANASTPLVQGDAVFAASGYGNGGGRADIEKDGDKFKAKEKFFVRKFLNQHGGSVLYKGHIYGTNEAALMCVDFKTGEVDKSVRGAGKGSVAVADGMVYQRGENGTVCLIEADPKTLKEKGRFTPAGASGAKTWAAPVIAGGKLYLRDWDTLAVYDVKKK